MDFLAQATPPPPNFWSGVNGSPDLLTKIILGLVLGIGLIFVLMSLPTRARRPIVALVTFLAGAYYVAYFFWPRPVDRQPFEMPQNAVEKVSFWLEDALPIVSNFTNILTGFLLGLGIFSLIRVHGKRLVKQQKDWMFSAVLLASSLTMIIIGYMDWISRRGAAGSKLDDRANWGTINYAADFMFDGLLQQMDAAMFSIIAFFILSAAYRAFRIRSVEATVLLASALLVMLSLMGAVEYLVGGWIDSLAGGNKAAFIQNFSLTEIRGWLQTNVQTPSIRGIDFGIGIGALAMGLRLWLSLERSGTGS
jgi:hypothetical protein